MSGKTLPLLSNRRNLRRQEIIRTARQLVAQEGLEALTVSKLEQQLSFTRGVLTYHFKDKNDLINAVFESAIADIDRATALNVEESKTLEEKIQSAMKSNIQGFLKHPEAARVLLSFWGRLHCDQTVRSQTSKLFSVYRKRSAQLIKAGQFKKVFNPVNARDLARIMVGIVIGLAIQFFSDPENFDEESVIQEAGQLLLNRLQKT